MGGAGEKVLEGVLGVFQFFVVGDEAAGLHGENEVRGSGFAPGVKGFGGRQAIKAVVNFDAVEVLEVEVQHFGGRSFRRVKRSDPMFVVEAGGADADVAGHAKEWMALGGEVLAYSKSFL